MRIKCIKSKDNGRNATRWPGDSSVQSGVTKSMGFYTCETAVFNFKIDFKANSITLSRKM